MRSEGGTAEEIVSEENGILISMLLRQYFMSLKVLGKWRRWGENMGRHWGGVHDELHQAHPVREPKVPNIPRQADDPAANRQYEHTDGNTQKSTANKDGETMPSLVGKAQQPHHPMPVRKKQKTKEADTEAAVDDGTHEHHLSDSEDDHSDLKPVPTESSQRERELVIMRKVMRKWWRSAGLQGHPNLCDELGEEFGVHWTKVRS